MESYLQEFRPPPRLLMGAGPSNVHPRVVQAMTAPMLGHLDPEFLGVMDDVREMLRLVFQTRNEVTLPISGTGTAGMDAALMNVLEPGDTIVIGANGYFAQRMADIAGRCGATACVVVHPAGSPVDPDALRAELRNHPKTKAVAVVHAETSTGVLTPLAELGDLAHQHDALLIVDAVTSLGGVELRVDEWGVDVCFSGTQKCLACPPGLAPLTLSDRALEVLEARKSPVPSFYLDVATLRQYWRNQDRTYHHTAPIIMVYALREGLRLVLEEGLEERCRRHTLAAAALRAGLEAMGLTLFAQEGCRLPSLTSVAVPDGVNDAEVRKTLLGKYNVEISGGLTEQAGRLWRVGLMGYNATAGNVLYFLSALEGALSLQEFELPVGASLAAAQQVLLDGALSDGADRS